MLAKMGYVALAIDMYGDGKLAAHPEDAGKFAMSVMGNIESAKARFEAALAMLKSQESVDADKIAAIGYCFGGSVALTMANAGFDLDAVAAFHSGVQLPVMPTSDIKAKILVCNGAEDPFIPLETVERYKRAMDSVKADYKYIAYENATHSFTSKVADSIGKKFNLPLAYQKEADEKSWAELKHLLEEAFK
ncbi:dienelactone hydrolase family protein [Aquimarina gracilis]|uniref:Dienelactone hydrolase family protein n=1 Tax=Aquimarina gracilis TaxID=874422 RepID=A0ABU6A1D0_9FLAO|nr:dienelactone hydrolase family protein [Aquimarina gracilis]MEB3347924.1 dienelactone hydrolase family protein [Aquimarina gracilis]